MIQAINSVLTGFNSISRGFCGYTAGIFIQASVLIVLLLVIDFLLQKRVRAVFRYCLWMLLLIKLVLPASFTLPTGIGYWLGDYFTRDVSVTNSVPRIQQTLPIIIDMPQGYNPLETAITNQPPATGVELVGVCWQGLIFSGWLVGMFVLLALLVKRICFVRRLITQSTPANERLIEMLDECRCRIGIRQNIEMGLTGNTHSPAVCGLFKPIILIPADLLEKLSKEKVKAVLIHELAHIKRADIWVNLLQAMLQIVYFYNPLLWIANAMIRRTRELAVDEMVLVTLKSETRHYSNTLIDIAEMAFWRPNFSLCLIGVVESKKALERRIKHMLNRPVPKSSKLGILGLSMIMCFGVVILPMASNPAKLHAEEAPVKDKIIVPGQRVGEYTFDMSKDDVLKKLKEPKMIFYGDQRYSLDNLPETYYMGYDGISFRILDDSVKEITAGSPVYKFKNGLGVGDSEKKIKKAFGKDFHIKESVWKDFLIYEDKGLSFEINKKDRTVMEINVLPLKSLTHRRKADIPATSTINEQGHIVDKTDYPFVNDPKAVGGWKSVDFVRDIDQFDPAKKNWGGELFLNHLIFEKGGNITGNILTWTKDLVLSYDTASKYVIRKISGSTYMFFEWKSGDYTIRHTKPSYYVLRKVLAESLKYEPMVGKKAYIPPTSTINEKGHIEDKIDYPFVNDPKVIGTWNSVDFVGEIEQFKADKKDWRGKLYLQEMIFVKNGKVIMKSNNSPRGYAQTWTRGLILYDNDTKTASKYTLKKMNGSTYMFREWKSGDYSFRHQKPSYYVLKKTSSKTASSFGTLTSVPNDPGFVKQLPARIEQLDIDTANLEKVKEIFGKPVKYVWDKETFTEDNLPRQYILVYPGRFHIYMNENEIVELRHEFGSSYVFRDKLRVGSSLDEAFEVIGLPDETVEGENLYEDGVLYQDIDGNKGHCYYARSDQDVRLWFSDYKLIAIYMTCSDYGTWVAPKKGLLGIEINNNRWPIVNVIPNFPAAKAGMQNGDKILKVNDEDVTHITTIRGALAVLNGAPGQKVKLTVQRDEQILNFEVERSK